MTTIELFLEHMYKGTSGNSVTEQSRLRPWRIKYASWITSLDKQIGATRSLRRRALLNKMLKRTLERGVQRLEEEKEEQKRKMKEAEEGLEMLLQKEYAMVYWKREVHPQLKQHFANLN